MTNMAVENLGQLQPVLSHARELLHPMPAKNKWTPYLGETLDGGMATLLAAETIEAIRYIYKQQPEPYPGFALSGGTANGSSDNGLSDRLNGAIDDLRFYDEASRRVHHVDLM